MWEIFPKCFHASLDKPKTLPKWPRSEAKLGTGDSHPCSPIAVRSKRILQSKRVSIADLTQPYGGKLLGIKKLNTPDFSKLRIVENK